jgi:hypothetical protein
MEGAGIRRLHVPNMKALGLAYGKVPSSKWHRATTAHHDAKAGVWRTSAVLMQISEAEPRARWAVRSAKVAQQRT